MRNDYEEEIGELTRLIDRQKNVLKNYKEAKKGESELVVVDGYRWAEKQLNKYNKMKNDSEFNAMEIKYNELLERKKRVNYVLQNTNNLTVEERKNLRDEYYCLESMINTIYNGLHMKFSDAPNRRWIHTKDNSYVYASANGKYNDYYQKLIKIQSTNNKFITKEVTDNVKLQSHFDLNEDEIIEKINSCSNEDDFDRVRDEINKYLTLLESEFVDFKERFRVEKLIDNEFNKKWHDLKIDEFNAKINNNQDSLNSFLAAKEKYEMASIFGKFKIMVMNKISNINKEGRGK